MSLYNLREKESVDYRALSGITPEMTDSDEQTGDAMQEAEVRSSIDHEGMGESASEGENEVLIRALDEANQSFQLQQQLEDENLDVDGMLEEARRKHQRLQERQAKMEKLQELARINRLLEKGKKREQQLLLSQKPSRTSKGAGGFSLPAPKPRVHKNASKSRSRHGDHALSGEPSTAKEMAEIINRQCESMGLTTDSSGYSESSSDSETSSRRHRRKGKKSGIHETNKMYVKRRQKFPQAALRPEFLARKSSPTFEELQLPLFVAGELEIIIRKLEGVVQKGNTSKEAMARLQMLRKTAYRADYLDWPVLRSTHEAILRNIENGFAAWDSNFEAVEKQVIERSASRKAPPSAVASKYGADKPKNEKKWYCGAFNKGECEFIGKKHRQELLGKERTVYHICSSCLTKEGREAPHSALAAECPHKE